MPGTPATSPRFGVPRTADADIASFSAQVNAITDTFDASAAHLGKGEGLLPGDLVTSAANTRTGCLLCDGSAVSRTTYATLFAAIGATYGSGDGSSTFNLPDYRGRTIIGGGAGPGLTARTRGQTGGTETVALVAAESGTNGNGVTNTISNDHSHSFSGTTGVDSPDHAHQETMGAPTGTFNLGSQFTTHGLGGDFTAGASARHAHSFSGQTGGVSANHTHALVARNADSAHNNVQPFGVANVFIKT